MKAHLQFGAMCPSIASQLRAQRVDFDREKVKHIQKDMDSMTRLAIRGYLSDAQKRAMLRKFIRRLEREVFPSPPSTAGVV